MIKTKNQKTIESLEAELEQRDMDLATLNNAYSQLTTGYKDKIRYLSNLNSSQIERIIDLKNEKNKQVSKARDRAYSIQFEMERHLDALGEKMTKQKSEYKSNLRAAAAGVVLALGLGLAGGHYGVDYVQDVTGPQYTKVAEKLMDAGHFK